MLRPPEIQHTAKTSDHTLKVLTILTIVLFSLTNFCSGSAPKGPFLTMYLLQGYVIDALSGKGYNPSTLATLTTINSVNPAALVDLKRGFGFSYQYDTKIRSVWIADSKHQRIFNTAPQSAGLTVTLRNLHLGLAMDQVYNSKFLYHFTSNFYYEPWYIGPYTFHSEVRESVHHYSCIAAYDFGKYRLESQSLSIGLQVNYNQYHLYQQYGITMDSDSLDNLYGTSEVFKKTIDAFNIAAGIRYIVHTEIIPRISIGAYYETFVRFKKIFDDTNFDDRKDNPTTRITRFDFFGTRLGEIPDKFHTGVYLEMPCGLYFSSNLSYLFWRNTAYSVKNQPEFAVNIGFPACKNLNLSGGVFYTHYRRTDFSDKWNNKFKAVYLMAGGTLNLKNFSLELTVADSHLFSGEYRKQTLVKAGIGYSF